MMAFTFRVFYCIRNRFCFVLVMFESMMQTVNDNECLKPMHGNCKHFVAKHGIDFEYDLNDLEFVARICYLNFSVLDSSALTINDNWI